MAPEAELLQALKSGNDPTRLGAWLDLFLQLAQSRIESLRAVLAAWSEGTVVPFAALRLADELAGLSVEQASPSLATLSAALASALRRHSGHIATPEQRQSALDACEELWRPLHQHAAAVRVVTPPHILQKLGADPN